MFKLTSQYWIIVWSVMALTVLVIWVAVIVGSVMMDKSADNNASEK